MAFNLAELGQVLNAGAGAVNNFRQQRTLADLGTKLHTGDYKGAAQTALAVGDVDTGLKLLSLGQQREADAQIAPLLGGVTTNPPSAGVTNFRDAIASIESRGSGDYNALGPQTGGDRAYGRYQVMGKNIPQWTQQALGQALTPEQFLKSPEAQDKVFDTIFGGYVKQTGSPQDAASMWFTGKPLAQGANRRDVNGMSGQQYASRFSQALGGGQPVQVADASGRIPQSAGGGADQLQTRLETLTRALAIPNISASAKAAIQAQIENTRNLISRSDRQEDISFRRQERLDNRTAKQEELALKRQERADQVEKQTGEQANAATFATRMEKANRILSDPNVFNAGLGVSGGVREAVKNIPGVGNALAGSGAQGPQFQKLDQARRDFVNAVLRKESGAAISASEFANAERQYFPVPGDSQEVIAQKADNRKTAIETIAQGGTNTFRKEFSQKRGAQSGGPSVGAVEDGYRFKGGDPATPSSWVKVQ
jgi:hypothetical protein